MLLDDSRCFPFLDSDCDCGFDVDAEEFTFLVTGLFCCWLLWLGLALADLDFRLRARAAWYGDPFKNMMTCVCVFR